jgi:RNA polymerase sigma-70 factor (ECF subfamily)
MATDTTLYLQQCLDRLQAGDEEARKELVNTACERLRRLTRKMLRADGRLRRWEETDDVFQNAMLRLYQALQDISPVSVREFFRLAAVQVRRELIDLARHYYGPFGLASRHQWRQPGKDPDSTCQAAYDAADSSQDPSRLASWSEFHEQIGVLPDEEREVFDLIWYQGLTQDEAANVLQVSTRTVKRRWRTPISSSNSFRDLGTGKDSRIASASGRPASRRPIQTTRLSWV